MIKTISSEELKTLKEIRKYVLINSNKYKTKYYYYVTSEGQIWSEYSKRFLKTQLDKDGYAKVRLVTLDNEETKRYTFSVHRLVLENFNTVKNMDTLQVNLIDGNKNNNKLNNLEWVASKQNIEHAIENNLRTKVNGVAKLSVEEVKEIIDLLINTNLSYKEIGSKYNVCEETIGRIKRKKLWKNITKNICF